MATKKQKRTNYWAVKCPYCEELTTGTWKEKMTLAMWQHITDSHMQSPIVYKIDGKGKVI